MLDNPLLCSQNRSQTRRKMLQTAQTAVDCFKRNLLPHFVNEQLTRFHRVAGQVRDCVRVLRAHMCVRVPVCVCVCVCVCARVRVCVCAHMLRHGTHAVALTAAPANPRPEPHDPPPLVHPQHRVAGGATLPRPAQQTHHPLLHLFDKPQVLYRLSDMVVPCNATFNTVWELWLGTDPNRLMPLLNALEIEHYPCLQVRTRGLASAARSVWRWRFRAQSWRFACFGGGERQPKGVLFPGCLLGCGIGHVLCPQEPRKAAPSVDRRPKVLSHVNTPTGQRGPRADGGDAQPRVCAQGHHERHQGGGDHRA
jgi:hypothetical protein